MRRLNWVWLAIAALTFHCFSQSSAQVPDPRGTSSLGAKEEFGNSTRRQHQLRSRSLDHADAESVAQALSRLFPDASVVSEKSTNTIYFRADNEVSRQIEEFAEQVELRAEKQDAKRKEAAMKSEKQNVTHPFYRFGSSPQQTPRHTMAFHFKNADGDKLRKLIETFLEPVGGNAVWDAEHERLVVYAPRGMLDAVTQLVDHFSRQPASPSRQSAPRFSEIPGGPWSWKSTH